MNRISNGNDQYEKYDAYLNERESNFNNPTFYIDVTEFLFPINGTLALQILSSVADLSIEDALLYKSLAYYFKQYKAYKDTLYVAKKVAEWRSF